MVKRGESGTIPTGVAALEQDENREILAETDYPILPAEPGPIVNWNRMIQQAIISLLVLVVYFGLSRMPVAGPLNFIAVGFQKALRADADSTFGVIARQPVVDRVTKWSVKMWQGMQTVPVATNSIRLVPPVPGGIILPFGWNAPSFGKEPVFHAGVDLEAAAGATVRASGAGTVREVLRGSDGFWQVTLTHPGGWRTVYGHCAESRVRVGQGVEEGQALGSAGNDDSGRAVVHWEIWHALQPVDPKDFL